jgi:hypothetical protein
MATEIVEVSRGATGEPLAGILQADGAVIDLTGCAVTFTMVRKRTPTVAKINAAAVTIVSAAAGTVTYPWTDTDVDTAGVYHGQFRVVLPSGKDIYIPTNRDDHYLEVHVIDVIPTSS